MAKFLPADTAYCRFTGEAFTVVSCDGAVVIVLSASGTVTSRIVGDLTRTAPAAVSA